AAVIDVVADAVAGQVVVAVAALQSVVARFGEELIVSCASLEQVDRKSTRLNSSHLVISYAVFCLKKKKLNISQLLSTAHCFGLIIRSNRTSRTLSMYYVQLLFVLLMTLQEFLLSSTYIPVTYFLC